MGLDTYLGGTFFIIGSGVLAVVGLLLTRRLIDLNGLRASHDVGGYLLSVVGTLYAVLLGLIVVDAMQKFQQARDITEKEANCLADIFILSSCLDEPKRNEIKNFCIDYSNQVVNTEWKDMDNGSYCPVARRMAVSLLQDLIKIEPKTENQKVLYAQMVADASQIWQCRRTRINMVLEGIPTIEWITLIAGGIITVFFTFFFGLENLRLQIAMTAMVAMLISLNMYLVILFGYPFSGDLKVSTEAFRINQGIYENRISTHR